MATFNSPSDSSFKPKDMELIFSTTLTSPTNSITTGTLPTGYKSYHINARARSDNAGYHITTAYLFFNNDTSTSNYQIQRILGSTTTTGYLDTRGQAKPAFFVMPGPNGGAAHFFGGATIQIYSPESTTGYKSFNVHTASQKNTGTSTEDRVMYLLSGLWRNTAAITEITFQIVGSHDWVVGSSFEIYGLK